jgi:hypothetical protein
VSGLGGVPYGDDYVLRRIKELEHRLDTIANQRTLEAAAITEGGITVTGGGVIVVKDSTDDRAVTLGLLSDSSYGLSVTDPISGADLPLSRIAFGQSAAVNTGTFTCAGNGVWRTDITDTSVTVTDSTGRLEVTVSAVAYSALSAASNAVMSWTITGTASIAADNLRALVVPAAPAAAGYASTSFTFLHTGLAPGTYTVTPQYRCDQWGATADSSQFKNRSLIVQPY